MSPAWLRVLLRGVSLLVPSDRRREWIEEWHGELGALAAARASGATGLPGPLEFVAGAVPHALWMRTEGWTMDSVLQDLGYAARVLWRSPGFTAVAVLTLTLGIGANGAIFSFVNGLVLRPPAVLDQPERLVQIGRSYEDAPRWDNFSWPALRLIRAEGRTLSGVAGSSGSAFVLGRGDETERVYGELVTGDYFDVLGVRPFLGRLIQPRDLSGSSGAAVVVLSHALWTRRYGADPGTVGRTIQIGSEPYEVVGVTPPGFVGADHLGSAPELYVLLTANPRAASSYDAWGTSWIDVVGRLADGVDFAAAEASMGVVSERLRDADPANEDILVLLADGVGLDPEARQEARQLSVVLLLIVGLVLLITCTNVANLLLSRATTRRTEVSVRVAMGASRSRLIRQLATESILLAGLATLLAVPVATAAGRVLPLLSPYSIRASLDADARVYLFLVVTGALAGLLFGLAPAWISTRSVIPALRESAATETTSRTRVRDALVVSQLALSLGLVTAAALLGRSVANAASARPGFEPDGVLAASVDLYSTGRYDEQGGRDFYARLLDEAARIPGVRSVSLANQLPVVGGHSRATVQPVERDDVSFEAEYVIVTADYFQTLGIPIVRGRALGASGDEAERVVVVNEVLASLFWPDEDPIGKELEGGDGTWRVVGVAGNVQMRSLRSRANPAVYYPLEQLYSPFMSLQVASSAGARTAPAAVRSAVATVDPEVPVPGVVDLEAALVASMQETRTIGYLVSAFAGLALVLAVVGLYGLVSYGAAQRVREMGIRMALGARPESLVRLVLRRALVIATLGVVVGLGVAYGLGTALGGLLFGVCSRDPLTLLGAAALLLGSAAVAAWVPARRATRVDAAVSLRSG